MQHALTRRDRIRVSASRASLAVALDVQSVSYVAIAFLSHFGLTQLGFMLAAMVMVAAVFMMVRLNGRMKLSAVLA